MQMDPTMMRTILQVVLVKLTHLVLTVRSMIDMNQTLGLALS